MLTAIPFADARKYLARVLPWPADGEAPAFVNVHNTFTPSDGKVKTDAKGKKLYPWAGIAFQSLDQAIKYLAKKATQPGSRDFYVCMSAQLTAEAKQSKFGSTYYKAIRSQPNAAALKSLFIDIDTNVTKSDDSGYLDEREAIKALGAFLTKSRLPRPNVVVNSGGGLHVYWVMARALTPDEWKPLAFALAEATKREGLKCDAGCTIDCARVLRIPNTFNMKPTDRVPPEPKLPVKLASYIEGDYSVERMQQALLPYAVAVPATASSFIENAALFAPRQSVPDELGAGIEKREFAPINLDEVAKECQFIRDTLATGGKNNTNPLWNITTLIATFTEGAGADAHRMGQGHPGYAQADTDALFNRKEREKAEKNLGWPSCKTISGSGCTACQGCVHFAAGKSPLAFTPKPTPAQLPVTPLIAQLLPSAVTAPQDDLPRGYARLPDGVVCEVRINADDGSQTMDPVWDYPALDPWLQQGEGNSEILNFTTVIRNKPRHIIFPARAANTMDMVKELQSNALYVPAGKGKERVGRFFVNWLTKLQTIKDVINAADFGWTVAHGKAKSFVYGGRAWSDTGDTQAPSPDSTLARMYMPSGDMQPWRDALPLVMGMGRPDLEAVVAAAFAAPLVRFTGHTGFTMSAFSQESGAGKSTALAIGQSVWGDPIRGKNTLNDTYNFTMGKMGRLKSLPIYWDELKSEDHTKKFIDMAFAMTLGVEKGRATRNAGLRDSGTWSTILTCCTNDSLLAFVTNNSILSTAGLYRLFEFEVKKAVETDPGMIDSTVATRMVGRLTDNYGHAGLEYAKFIGANAARIDAELGETLKALNEEVKGQQDERFWVSLMACLLQGAQYANDLGLTFFDLDALRAFLIGVLNDMRGTRKDTHVDMKTTENIASMFAQFWAAQRSRHVLVTDRVPMTKGRPPAGSIKVECDLSRLEGVRIQLARKSGVMRISSSAITDWCTQTRRPSYQFIKGLKDRFGARPMVGLLGSGVDARELKGVISERLYEIDLNAIPQDLIEF